MNLMNPAQETGLTWPLQVPRVIPKGWRRVQCRQPNVDMYLLVSSKSDRDSGHNLVGVLDRGPLGFRLHH